MVANRYLPKKAWLYLFIGHSFLFLFFPHFPVPCVYFTAGCRLSLVARSCITLELRSALVIDLNLKKKRIKIRTTARRRILWISKRIYYHRESNFPSGILFRKSRYGIEGVRDGREWIKIICFLSTPLNKYLGIQFWFVSLWLYRHLFKMRLDLCM